MKFALVFFLGSLIASMAQSPQASLFSAINDRQCQKASPSQAVIYGNKKPHIVMGALFCERYMSRSCCTKKNLETLELKWMKEIYGRQLSTNCLDAMTQALCTECDGDIGQGLRSGLCEKTAKQLYDICKFDYFYFFGDNKLIPCSQNALVCSQLYDITKDSTEFVNLLGFEVNQMTQYDEEFMTDLVNNKTLSPPCHDLTPSSSIWGNAMNLERKQKDKSAILNSIKTLLMISSFVLSVILL